MSKKGTGCQRYDHPREERKRFGRSHLSFLKDPDAEFLMEEILRGSGGSW